MFERPLDSDTLGELGEKEFGALCAKANLIANAASRDRAGWDYIVDFRLGTALLGLDARPAPTSVRVQVKTQWDNRDVVKLRLSSAEQLVKHQGPSFVCVLSVSNDLQFVRMRMIHCRGEFLGRVLKRLREAELRGKKPNDVWLTIRPSRYSEAIEPHHEALRSALEAGCSTDHLAYLTGKDAELKTLGFEPGFTELNVTFAADEDEIVDAFLGLRPIEAKSVAGTETRFGVALPIGDIPNGPATLTFSPQPERCDLVFRTEDKTYKMRGRAFRPPGLINAAAARQKALIRTDLLRLVVVVEAGTQQISLTIGIDPDLSDDAKRKPREWRDAYAVLAAITVGGVDMELSYGKKRVIQQALRSENAESGPQWRKLSRLANAAALVFERAAAPNSKVTLQELWEAGDAITAMAAIVRDPDSVSGISFVTERTLSLPNDTPVTMMLGHAFSVGDCVLAYGAKVVVTGIEGMEDITWSSGTLELLGLSKVRSESAFYAFLDGLPRQPYRLITGTYQAIRSSRPGRLEAATSKK